MIAACTSTRARLTPIAFRQDATGFYHLQAANYFLPMYSDLVPGDFDPCRAVVGGTEVHFDASVLLSNSTTVTLLKSAAYT